MCGAEVTSSRWCYLRRCGSNLSCIIGQGHSSPRPRIRSKQMSGKPEISGPHTDISLKDLGSGEGEFPRTYDNKRRHHSAAENVVLLGMEFSTTPFSPSSTHIILPLWTLNFSFYFFFFRTFARQKMFETLGVKCHCLHHSRSHEALREMEERTIKDIGYQQ